jgi:hypothetical protein
MQSAGKIADSFKRFADIHLRVPPLSSTVLRIRWAISIAISFRVWRNIDSMLLLAGYYDAAGAPGWKTGKGLHSRH